LTETVKKWEKEIAPHLVGKTIEKIEYLTKDNADDMDWHRLPLAIVFTDGSWIFPMMDAEGNNGGVLATSMKGMELIPAMST
jgi:hypothetical protein